DRAYTLQGKAASVVATPDRAQQPACIARFAATGRRLGRRRRGAAGQQDRSATHVEAVARAQEGLAAHGPSVDVDARGAVADQQPAAAAVDADARAAEVVHALAQRPAVEL